MSCDPIECVSEVCNDIFVRPKQLTRTIRLIMYMAPPNVPQVNIQNGVRSKGLRGV